MKNFLFVLSAMTLCGAAHAQDKEPRGFDDAKLAKAGARVGRLVDEQKIGGAVVLVARDGKIAHFEAAGLRDLGSEAPMKKDTIFRIYSMTKPIVTSAAMMLVDDGKLVVDDPVSKYLPELAELKVYSKDGNHTAAKKTMTIADLMRHTSGLSYGFVGGGVAQMYNENDILSRDHTLADMVTKLKDIPLQEEPGTKWRYSISIDVLGRVVEVASGKSLDQFLNERIFGPLKMVDTAFHIPAEKANRFASQNRRTVAGKLAVGELASTSQYLKSPAFKSGGGGLCSTAQDYFHFCQMILNGGTFDGKRLLKAETVALMTRNQLPDSIPHIGIMDSRTGVGFGFGFNVRIKQSKWGFGGRIGEIGWGGAASTHFWLLPEEGLTVITLRNFMPYQWTLEAELKKPIYEAMK